MRSKLSVAAALLAGLTGVSATECTVNDYEVLRTAVNNPPTCGIPYHTLDLTRVTAASFIKGGNFDPQCGECINVCGKVGCADLMVIDQSSRSADHLDISIPAGPGIFGDNTGVYDVTYTKVDLSRCAGIWNGQGAIDTSPDSNWAKYLAMNGGQASTQQVTSEVPVQAAPAPTSEAPKVEAPAPATAAVFAEQPATSAAQAAPAPSAPAAFYEQPAYSAPQEAPATSAAAEVQAPAPSSESEYSPAPVPASIAVPEVQVTTAYTPEAPATSAAPAVFAESAASSNAVYAAEAPAPSTSCSITTITSTNTNTVYVSPAPAPSSNAAPDVVAAAAPTTLATSVVVESSALPISTPLVFPVASSAGVISVGASSIGVSSAVASYVPVPTTVVPSVVPSPTNATGASSTPRPVQFTGAASRSNVGMGLVALGAVAALIL